MGKQTTILATACIIIIVVVIFEFYVFRLSTYQTTTVSIITSDPSAWVNKTVVLKGSIDGPVMTPGDMRLPYAYELSSSGQTIGLSLSASAKLNPSVYTNQSNSYVFNSSLTLSVHGVVTKGETRYGWGMPSQVTYYLEAEEVEMA